MTAWKDVADTVQAFVTAGGIIVGGVFTYYKFGKDRIYRPRVDIGIECSRVQLGDQHLLKCRLTLENKGATKLPLLHKGTALIIRPGQVDVQPMRVPDWGDLDASAVIDVFTLHDWLESSETIRDEVLVSTDSDPLRPYRVELRIVVRHPGPRRKPNITISGACVVAGIG
jgi:hypothetical protein